MMFELARIELPDCAIKPGFNPATQEMSDTVQNPHSAAGNYPT
jgi:hypothetical protein